jgi:hypothetical protein
MLAIFLLPCYFDLTAPENNINVVKVTNITFIDKNAGLQQNTR